MKTAILCIYAFLVATGGIIGYIKAGSIASLSMGLTFGIALAICCLASMRHKSWSRPLTLVLIVALAGFFGWRLVVTQQLWPACGMLLLSLIALVSQIPFKNKNERCVSE